MQLKVSVEEIVNKTVEKLMSELRRERMLNGGAVVGGMSAYKKTEQLLYAYPKLVEIVESKREDIAELRENGLRKTSKSIVVWSPRTNVQEGTVLEADTVQGAVERIQGEIDRLEYSIYTIESALEKIKNDPYYDIIRLKYFEGLVNEAIADELGRDTSTITRNKNRLVSGLATYLFPTDKVDELLLL